MHITYLLNSYPRTSTTFIRREIEALERSGVAVKRYAARDWDEDLVDPLDKAEKLRTSYLLTGNLGGLASAFVRALVTNPVRLAKAAAQVFRLYRNARGGLVRHAAYFLQAIYFRQCTMRDGTSHVHVHFSTNATSVAMLAHTLGGPGYSFTVHGPDELVEPEALSLAMKTQQARFVVAISDFCRSQIIRFAGADAADKIKVMRCGLPLNDFEIAAPNDGSNKTLVCIGRLCPQKGQVMLPRIIARIAKRQPEVKIILIGDGESRAEIEAQIAQYGVAAHFELTGWMENARARQTLAASRGLLLPSFAEGLPIVIMEAMAAGKPVISTYIAGIPELLDATCGWIVPAGNEEKLEAAIVEMLEAAPDALATQGAEGRRRVEALHNIDALAHGLIVAATPYNRAQDR